MKIYSDNIKFYDHFTVIITEELETRSHSHYALGLIIGLESHFELVHSGTKATRARAVMIRANTMHRIRTGAGPTIFVLIDPQSPLGISLARAFNKGVAIVLGESSMTQLVSYFSKYLTHHYLDHELETSLTRIIVNSDAAEQPSNGRLKNILSLIKRGEGNTLSIFKNIVMETGLSESRLMHYFKAETGVTIRKYIQWLRIQQALKSIVQGCKINEASSSAGFTDAAHFNRIFVSTFGVNPSTITRATKEASRKRST